MNKMQDNNISPKEKEVLKKRLQTLFQKQENRNASTTSKINKRDQHFGDKNKSRQINEPQNITTNSSTQHQPVKYKFQKEQQPQNNKPARDKSKKNNAFVGKGTTKSKGQNFNKNSKNIESQKFEVTVGNKGNSKEQPVKQQSGKNKSKQNGFFKNTESSLQNSNQRSGSDGSQKSKEPMTVKRSSKLKKNRKNIKPNPPHDISVDVQQTQNANTNQNQKNNKNKRKNNSKPTQSSANTNGQIKLSKTKKKLGKKRAAATFNNNLPNSSKKAKFSDKSSSTLPSNSQTFNNYNVNDMAGYVQGGDFDYYDNGDNEMDHHNYWMQDENYNSYSEYGSEFLDSYDVMQQCNSNAERNIEQYEHNEFSVDDEEEEEDYFDSEDEYDEYCSDFEDENYSDFDENDYEEDEDSYNYSMDNDYSSSYDFNDEENDGDYNLPQHVAEDLIIHKGTATKLDIKPEDDVSFNSDNEEAQIIELENQPFVNVVQQPKAYDREALTKLKYNETTLEIFHKKKATTTSATFLDDCPKLVPIVVDEDGFQLYQPHESEEELEDEQLSYENEDYESMDNVSLGSEYMEINSDDADSFLSEDINEKYLNRDEDSDSISSIDENIWRKKHNADVIDATACQFEQMENKSNDNSDSCSNDAIEQILSVKLNAHVDFETKSSILSATIIDDEIFYLNKKNEEENTENKDHEESLEEPDIDLNDLENVAVQSAKPLKSARQSLVDYNTKFFNALDSNLVLVLLEDPFYIYGTVCLTLLAGKVEVYGHSLNVNTEIEIFSPRGCSVIEISPTSEKKNSNKHTVKEILKNYETSFALADLKTISDLYDGEKNAVVLLKRNEARKKVVQQFKKFMNENVFPNLNNINVDRPLYNSEYLLRCMINTSEQEQKCLRLPHQWQELSLAAQSRVMVAGGKSVGKSTLIRYLINRHLPQQILLIDLDIGQPEVFVPQTVSCTIIRQPLIGPGFLLNLQPEMSYAVGHTNIALCAHTYMAAVRNLIGYCMAQEEYNEMPWLINTMGYNKGFGLELLSVIAKQLPLTDLIQLQSSKDINNFDNVLVAPVLNNVQRNIFLEECGDNVNSKQKLDYRLHVWQSAVQQESRYQKEWEMSAKDLRFAILLARLSETLQGHAEWLTDCKPLSTSLNQLKIVNLMNNTPLATTQELAKSIEANLVYLCHYQEDNKPLRCFGIGVVRAIDFNIQQLYLIPAISHSNLKGVNCLAIGEMPLPTSLFINQGPRVKNIAPFVYNTLAAKSSKAIKQIYRRPREFLTGKHKSLD